LICLDYLLTLRHHIYPVNITQTKIGFLPSTEIRAIYPIELFGSKIKALIERTAARDLYDVYNMISNSVFTEEDLNMLRKSILFPQIRAHLIPVLRKSEQFDFEKAKKTVKEFLTALVVFTDKEKEFIKEFNNNNYVPELLFEDEEIIKRIKSHPMAIWKTRKTS
jgi:predicted nucleotidyltransferase component of viral defense system